MAKVFWNFTITGFLLGIVLCIVFIAARGLLMFAVSGEGNNEAIQPVVAEVLPADARTLPFEADFADADAEAGGIPPGWTATSPLVGVRKEGGNSWAEYRDRGTANLVSPPIEFPDTFQLEVLVWNTTGMVVELLSPGGNPTGVNFGFRRWGLILNDRKLGKCRCRYAPIRLRFVRDQTGITFIVEDRVVATDAISLNRRFGGMVLELQGIRPVPAAIEGVTIRNFPQTQPKAPTGFQIDFADTPVEGLPPGWWGSSSIEIAYVHMLRTPRTDLADRVLACSEKGLHFISTRDIQFPEDFILDANIDFESPQCNSRFGVVLQGDGTTPDIVLQLIKDTGILRSDHMSFTSASTINQSISAHPHIQISRHGQLFTVKNDGVTAFAQRMPDHHQFRAIGFLLDGDEQYSHLRSITLKPYHNEKH